MAAFELQRTGQPNLQFEGALLVQQLGLAEDNRTENRRHDISVYQAEAGHLIVAIHFYSQHDSELCDDFVEVVETEPGQTMLHVDVVEEILSLYQPEIYTVAGSQNRNADEDARITRELTRRYDLQVHAVLEALSQTAASDLSVTDTSVTDTSVTDTSDAERVGDE